MSMINTTAKRKFYTKEEEESLPCLLAVFCNQYKQYSVKL